MQMEKAKHLRREWGDKPCDHPTFDKEYYLSMQTGDYVCEQCGRSFFKSEVQAIREERADKS